MLRAAEPGSTGEAGAREGEVGAESVEGIAVLTGGVEIVSIDACASAGKFFPI
jgi:hypothetical protein